MAVPRIELGLLHGRWAEDPPPDTLPLRGRDSFGAVTQPLLVATPQQSHLPSDCRSVRNSLAQAFTIGSMPSR